GNAVLVFVNPLYLQTLPERINPDSRHFVIPAKAGIWCIEFQSFPINSCRVVFLDSRFRGNDGSVSRA
ncbi:pilS cassette, partial [Neisseria meningitidis]